MTKTGLPNLSFLRKERGLSQAKLAAAVGLCRPHISQIETGKRDTSQQAIKQIAAVLRVPMDRLFDEPDGPRPKLKQSRARKRIAAVKQPSAAVPFERLTSEYQQLGQQRRRIVAELATLDARLDTLLGLI